MYREVTDYFPMPLLILPLLVVSGGLSIFTSTMLKNVTNFTLLTSIGKLLIRLIPFILAWFTFIGLHAFISNVKVKLKYTLISGVLAGTAYRAFQLLHVSS